MVARFSIELYEIYQIKIKYIFIIESTHFMSLDDDINRVEKGVQIDFISCVDDINRVEMVDKLIL